MTINNIDVLLIEDNDDHAELIMRCFGDSGFLNRIMRIDDGEKALNYFQQLENENVNNKPKLVLLDLRLPKVDGFEILSFIKNSEVLKKLVVMVLTSSASQTDIEMAQKRNADDYLVKPLSRQKCNEIICKFKNLHF